MNDDNWELIDGPSAHEIEVLNYSNQVNVIEALFHLLMHHHEIDGSCSRSPSVRVLREFHRTATLFLLELPGDFRTEEVVVSKSDGTIVHTPPTFDTVESHLTDFFKQLVDSWHIQGAVEVGSFCLWFVNWVHPFKNGNGRSARAFCYACITLKLGFVLPGTKTVIDLIMQNRNEYQTALGIADASFKDRGSPDLKAMNVFVGRLLVEQLESI